MEQNNAFSIFSGLISSQLRIKILMRLFLDPQRGAYLRELAVDCSASPGHLKQELSQLTEVRLLRCEKNGRQLNYYANKSHPVFKELHAMVKKALGMDHIIDSIVNRLGNLELALLLGDYAEGKDTGIVDLLLVGNIDQQNLVDLVRKTERYIQRKIRTLCLTRDEYHSMSPKLKLAPHLLLWAGSEPLDENIHLQESEQETVRTGQADSATIHSHLPNQ
jgi:hypothetical protein